MSNKTKQEELKEMANHTVGNCFGSHSCFYMNLPTENTDSQNDEAIANEIVNRINQEVTSVLNELENQQTTLVQQDPISEEYTEEQWVTIDAIQALKQRYGGK